MPAATGLPDLDALAAARLSFSHADVPVPMCEPVLSRQPPDSKGPVWRQPFPNPPH